MNKTACFLLIAMTHLVGGCQSKQAAPTIDIEEKTKTCNNGVKDGEESDIDCGGYCNPCELGQQCLTGSDCASGDCNANGGYVCRDEYLERKQRDLAKMKVMLTNIEEPVNNIRRVIFQDNSEGRIPPSFLSDYTWQIWSEQHTLSVVLPGGDSEIDVYDMSLYFRIAAELEYEGWRHYEWNINGKRGEIRADLGNSLEPMYGLLIGYNDREQAVKEVLDFYWPEDSDNQPMVGKGDPKYIDWCFDHAEQIWLIANEMFEELWAKYMQ